MSLKFTYINLAFSPAPDDTIANLYRVSPSRARYRNAETNQTEKKSFATDGHLIVNYRYNVLYKSFPVNGR